MSLHQQTQAVTPAMAKAIPVGKFIAEDQRFIDLVGDDPQIMAAADLADGGDLLARNAAVDHFEAD